MRVTKILTCFLVVMICIGCEPPPLVQKGEYPQDFKTNVAFLVLEWGGRKPHILASGYLADRDKGIFYTAKHFTDTFEPLGYRSCRVFFNGKIYEAELVRVPPLRDAALIKIVTSFSPSEFPELMKIVPKPPEIGDEVYIRGFHPHSFAVRGLNQLDGFPDKVVPIFENYYGQVTKDLSKESQVVFDNLKGTVAKADPESIRNNRILDKDQKRELLKYESDEYIKVSMARDHRFSFGGLSGGLAVNSRDEVIGVITAQNPVKFEFDHDGLFFDPSSNTLQVALTVKKQIFDTIYITPIQSISDLDDYIRNLK